MKTSYFSNVPVGTVFRCNGTLYCKRTSRTAVMLIADESYTFHNAGWYYFRNKEVVREYHTS